MHCRLAFRCSSCRFDLVALFPRFSNSLLAFLTLKLRPRFFHVLLFLLCSSLHPYTSCSPCPRCQRSFLFLVALSLFLLIMPVLTSPHWLILSQDGRCRGARCGGGDVALALCARQPDQRRNSLCCPCVRMGLDIWIAAIPWITGIAWLIYKENEFGSKKGAKKATH